MTDHTPSATSTETPANRITTWAGIVGVAVGATLLGACVAPATSSMSLGSVSSISGSSASSAAHNARNHNAYYIDVRESTAAAILAQASTAEVLRSISRAATEHGISDWEAKQSSYVALGEGLRLGGLDQDQARAWISRLSGGNAKTASLITIGYQNS
jgi:hypothetical protein